MSVGDLTPRNPPFRADLTPSPPTYSAAPGTLAWILEALAIVLGLGAGAIVVSTALRIARRRRTSAPPDELSRALRLARDAERRPASDRRRALNLLARVLARDHRPLAEAADELAWARPAPASPALEALIGDVERKLTG